MSSYLEAKTYPEILIIRFDAALYYANVPFLEEWLIKAVADRPHLKWVIIDRRGVNTIDITAIVGLEDLVSGYRSREIDILFSHVKRRVREQKGIGKSRVAAGSSPVGYPLVFRLKEIHVHGYPYVDVEVRLHER